MSSENESVSDQGEVDQDKDVENIESDGNEAVPETDENEAVHENGDDKNDDDDSKKKVVKPKRIIKNPQPKFNEQTLRNSKGLPAINDHFKNLKFKGKGYEEHDLNIVMKTYEYWSHRFYPKFTFDDTIARLETLGTKRATQTYLRRIRLDMEVFEQDKLVEEKLANDNDEISTTGFVEPFDDRFDQLLSTHNPEPELTEEQLERIHQNKLRAETLRKARLSGLDQSSQISNHDTIANHTEHAMEVDEHTEMNLDSMLDMINEEPSTSSKNLGEVTEDQNKDATVSNSIRTALFKSLLSRDDNEEDGSPQNSQTASSQKRKSILDTSEESSDNESVKNSNEESDESHKESDEDSEAESVVLKKFSFKKKTRLNAKDNKKLKSIKSQKGNKRKRLTVGDDSDESNGTEVTKLKDIDKLHDNSIVESLKFSTQVHSETLDCDTNNEDIPSQLTQASERKQNRNRTILSSDEDSNLEPTYTKNSLENDKESTSNSFSSRTKVTETLDSHANNEDLSQISQASERKKNRNRTILSSDEDSNLPTYTKNSLENDKESTSNSFSSRSKGTEILDSHANNEDLSQISQASERKKNKNRTILSSDEDSNLEPTYTKNCLKNDKESSSNSFSSRAKVIDQSDESNFFQQSTVSYKLDTDKQLTEKNSLTQQHNSVISEIDSSDSDEDNENKAVTLNGHHKVIESDKIRKNRSTGGISNKKIVNDEYLGKTREQKSKTRTMGESDDSNEDEIKNDGHRNKKKRIFIESDDSNDSVSINDSVNKNFTDGVSSKILLNHMSKKRNAFLSDEED